MNEQSENNRIRAGARDNILCMIIGMQNELGQWKSDKCKAWQEVYDMIVKQYGGMFEPYK